jgi:transposase
LVLILQFLEDLDDAAAAEMVTQRVDWKYLLALSLADVGFDPTVLCEFRNRVVESELLQLFLDRLLDVARAEGLLKKRGQQRSDSTAVLGYVRELNRLELVATTLRAALESLAVCAPQWLKSWVPQEWVDRYGQRIENYRLPRDKASRRELAQLIGADGFQLLAACYEPDAPVYLRQVEAVEILRQVWIQQYYVEDNDIRWRRQEEQPPHSQVICSPYEIEARYATKRDTHWTGYKVHLTETCDPDAPRLITHVATTPSTTTDDQVTPQIHADLAARDLLPREHLVDTGYVDAHLLVESTRNYDVELLGPVPPDPSWQGRVRGGFDIPNFTIDWDAQRVTCPEGIQSSCWSLGDHPKYSDKVIHVRFPRAACQACASRESCTRSHKDGRTLTFLPREPYEAQQARREELRTQAFWQKYKGRSGVEGTISQAVRGFGMRKARYRGLAKTHLQHVLTACALNMARLMDWFDDHPPRRTRTSHLVRLVATPA